MLLRCFFLVFVFLRNWTAYQDQSWGEERPLSGSSCSSSFNAQSVKSNPLAESKRNCGQISARPIVGFWGILPHL